MLNRKLLHVLAEAPAYLLPAPLAQRLAAWLYLTGHQLFAPASLRATARTVQLALAEPHKAARRISSSSFAAKGRQRSNYRSMARQSCWPQAETDFPPAAHAALADANRPLVLLTLHQADYLAGLLAVLRLIPTERDIHIIKLAEWSRIEEDAYKHFGKYGHTLVIHRLSDRPAKRIVRALKRKAILVTFVDVPREFGSTVGVQMFDLPFQLTSGPLAMARLAGASVLPLFASYDSAGQRQVRSGPAIAASANGKKRSVATMAQLLATQIEANLRTHAAQWEMWPVLNNLLDLDALASDSSSLSPDAMVRLRLLGARALPQPPTPLEAN